MEPKLVPLVNRFTNPPSSSLIHCNEHCSDPHPCANFRTELKVRASGRSIISLRHNSSLRQGAAVIRYKFRNPPVPFKMGAKQLLSLHTQHIYRTLCLGH
eukprot:1137487-Pelagomonas_calceolata.AAC.4